MDADGIVRPLSDVLASAMFHAYEQKPAPRTSLYVWERDAFIWLLDYRAAGGKALMSAWTAHFMRLNEAAIRSNGRMDFNLRADDERHPSPERTGHE